MHDAMRVTLNGERRELAGPTSVASLLAQLGLDPRKLAVERNLEIVPRSRYAATWLATATGSRSCTSSEAAEMDQTPNLADRDDTWTVAGRTFRSRLIVGTGKYKDFAQNAAAAEAAGRRSSPWRCGG